MNRIAIIGHGGFGREVKMLIDQINCFKQTFELVGFYDDNSDAPAMINGIPYSGTISELSSINHTLSIALGIGSPEVKRQIIDRISHNTNLHFPNLIHPSAIIGSDNVILGKGNIVCAGCIFTIDIQIGDFTTFNLMCSLGHDSIIGDYCSFMPGVNISGEVHIDDSVYVGTGAKIINQTRIGNNSIIGAGAVVAKGIPPNCTAVGVPAKPIKFNTG